MATSKKKGIKSSAQDNFLAPGTPTVTGVADVGTGRAYGNGAVDVSFSATGVYAASSYTVLSSGGQTATGSSSPIRVEGLASDTAYTFTVKATNDKGDSAYSSASSSVTVTTVPAAPTSPTASSPSAGNDTFSWTAGANGGKAITNYHWESNDGKSGDAGTSTSANISQEQGTAQTYRVYATNANGNSSWSSDSNSVTTTFSFVPFSVFGFSPFGVFGFSPFGFSPFGVFGFSPFGVFGFSPFGFSPFGVFGFSPFGFSPFGFSGGCIDQDTLIQVVGPNDTVEYKKASDVQVGEEVWAPHWAELVDESVQDPASVTSTTLTAAKLVKTIVRNKVEIAKDVTMVFNNDPSKRFSLEQGMLVRSNGEFSFINSGVVQVGDELVDSEFSPVPVTHIELINEPRSVYKFDCEDLDTFIAANLLMHNGKVF